MQEVVFIERVFKCPEPGGIPVIRHLTFHPGNTATQAVITGPLGSFTSSIGTFIAAANIFISCF